MSQQDPEATESVADALARARVHARAAATESVAALRALLDAGALATSGSPADRGALSPLAEALSRFESWLAGDALRDAALFESMLDALDAEILRWEQRSRSEPEARTVLRTFLAVRELLWELAPDPRDRPEEAADPSDAGSVEPVERTEPEAAPRLRRVRVQG